MKGKFKLIDLLFCFLLGLVLGVLAKFLDTIAVDGTFFANVLHYFAQLFTRLGIWVLLATLISVYSKTMFRAAMNTFLFFIGMLISYYIYSAILFGFFPTSYFIFWGSIALVSPILATMVWQGKHHENLSMILPALPIGLMLSLSLGMGLFYIDMHDMEEFLMCIILVMIFYKNWKQMGCVVLMSVIIAIFLELFSPYQF